jgi:hypothetical protein
MAKDRITQLVDDLSSFFYHRYYHMRMWECRDIQPDNDPYGLWVRGINRHGLCSYTYHFRPPDLIPPGYTWVNDGFFNGVPDGDLDYDWQESYMKVSGSDTPYFMCRNVTTWHGCSYAGRIRANYAHIIGIRIDDGADPGLYYAEIVCVPDTQGCYRVEFWYNNGAGEVVVPGPLYHATEFTCMCLKTVAYGQDDIIEGYLLSEDGVHVPVLGWATPALAWIPGRAGVVLPLVGNGDESGIVDWVWTDYA